MWLPLIDWMKHIDHRVERLEHKMANVDKKVTDFIGQVEVNFTQLDTDLKSLAAGVVALDAIIQQLQGEVANLDITPETQALMDKAVADSAALVTEAGAINVTPPVPPTA